MKAIRLTNQQIETRNRPNLNAEFAEILLGAGWPVVHYDNWRKNQAGYDADESPLFVREFPFAPNSSTWDYSKTVQGPFKSGWGFKRIRKPRKWRWDFYVPGMSICIELDGGSFIQGGHSRGAQSCRDYLKRNEAEIDGFMVLRFDANMVRKGVALDFVQRAIAARHKNG
jgi:very-short-patch-repair endonuclease